MDQKNEAGLRGHVHAAIRDIKKAEEAALNLSAKNKMEMLHRLIGIEQELTELLNVYNGDAPGDGMRSDTQRGVTAWKKK